MTESKILQELKTIHKSFFCQKNQPKNYIQFLKNWNIGINKLEKLIENLENKNGVK